MKTNEYRMKQEYQLLHHGLLQDIERCMQLDLPETEKMESCFWISHNYWGKLKGWIKQNDFQTEQEEQAFFRDVKPQFTCYMEYFAMLSEAVKFQPEQLEAAIAFWEMEGKKFTRFCSKHENFISYYESGQRHSDPLYFLRENNHAKPAQILLVFDNDSTLLTSHDHVLRSYLANKKYNEYTRKKLETLWNEKRLNDNG